ncbi:integrase core domain-containing protein [Roseovarius arcticus]|uniref:integrase core domain-containing protein n=1 Tax=Roseovarius arcticus TaxID=2547404 RepID=UPI0011106FC6
MAHLHEGESGQQNGFIENLNGKLREECLSETLFGKLREALKEWQRTTEAKATFRTRQTDADGIHANTENGQNGLLRSQI